MATAKGSAKKGQKTGTGKKKKTASKATAGELRQSARSAAPRARKEDRSERTSATVSDVMAGDPLAMLEIATVAEAAERMLEAGADTVVVLNDTTAHPTGIVTFGDIVLRAVAEGRDPATTTLSNVQTDGLVVVDPDAPVEEAVALMRQRGIRRIPVVEGRDVLGMVTIESVASAVEPGATLGALAMQQT